MKREARTAAPAAPAYPGDLLTHLRSFTAVATAIERGDRAVFARAAADLVVDVSVLRRRLQTLAEHVGSPLLEGRGASLRLSRAGARAHANAVRALEAADELARPLRDDAGPLRISCTGTILAEVLPPVLRAMRDEHPRLRFRVRRAGAEASRAMVARGDVDFAVIRAATRPEGLTAVRVGADRLWLAVPAGSALGKTRRASLDAIAREPIVGYGPASSTMRRVMEVLGPLGATPWIEVDGKVAALSYVAAGLGVAFVSALSPQEPTRAGVVTRDVTAWFASTSFWLVSSAGAGSRARQPPWAARFAELLRASAAG